MTRNAFESDFRSSKMAAGSHLWKKKVAYWSEMARNPIESDFRSSKMAAGSHFVEKIKKNKSSVLIWNGEKCDRKWFSVIQNGRRQPFCEQKKVAYGSEIMRNAIESDFRSSKMVAGSHFVNKIKNWVLIWNGKKCDWSSKMAAGSHFVKKKNQSCVLKWREVWFNSFSVIQNGGGGGHQMASL